MTKYGDEDFKRGGHRTLKANEKTVPPEPLSVRRNILFNTIGSLTYQGCLWLTTVLVVTLSSGYVGSGVLALAMTVGNMFNPIATYSMRTFQVSDVKGAYSQGCYVGFRLVTTVIGLAFVVPYAIVVGDSQATTITILLYMLFKIDEAFVDVLYGVDQRGERMDYIGISQFLRGVAVIAFFSGGLVAFQSLDAAVLGMFFAGLAMTVFYDIPHASRIGRIRPAIAPNTIAALLRKCLPLVVSTLLISMVVSVARQYFSWACGVDQLGLYAAVATPAVLIQALARYLYAPSLVPLAERWESGEDGAFVRYLLKTIRLMVAFIVIMVVGLSLVGSPVLVRVYGESIAAYTYLFPYVLISTGCIALMWFLSDVLVICRDMRGLLVSNVVAFASCALLMVPLETAFGMNGINFVVIASMTTGAVVAALYLRRAIVARSLEADGCESSSGRCDLKVSVLIPVFNAEDYLARCIDSVLAQTYRNFEIIAIDDGSSDGSASILDGYAMDAPGRFVVEHRENAGAAMARNRAMELATGDYIVFVDNDDYLDPDYLESFICAAGDGEADIVLGGYRRPDENGRVRTQVSPVPGTEWAPYAVEAAWAKLYRTEFVRRASLEFLPVNISEDLFFTLPATTLSQKSVVIPYCGYNWFLNPGSVSSTVQRRSEGLQFELAINRILVRLRDVGTDFDKALNNYVFIRLVVWFLLYTARGDGGERTLGNLSRYREWLDKNLPGWKSRGYVSPARPTGDALQNRVAVWLFVRHPKTFRWALMAYGRR